MTDPQTAAIFDEIMKWGGVAPLRQDNDFTVSEFAGHITRSEPAARRVLQQQVEEGRLASEKRYDPAVNRTVRVWWVKNGS